MVATPIQHLEEEARWWELHWAVADRQWEMPRRLNQAVRAALLQEMRAFLRVPGGRLLDIGCGTGWLGLQIAGNDMDLVGIDTSPAQIEKARIRADIGKFHRTRFHVATVADLSPDERFDSAVIHAVLHHLPREMIGSVLDAVADRLAEGGHLFIYEPLEREPANYLVRLLAATLFGLIWSPFWLLHAAAFRLRLGPRAFRKATGSGWTGLSPHERPVPRRWLMAQLQPRYAVPSPRYWHAYSLAFAMGCSQLPPRLVPVGALGARCLYWLDCRLLLSSVASHLYGVWTFASISAVVKRPGRAARSG